MNPSRAMSAIVIDPLEEFSSAMHAEPDVAQSVPSFVNHGGPKSITGFPSRPSATTVGYAPPSRLARKVLFIASSGRAPWMG